MKFVTRAQWGAKAPKRPSRALSNSLGVVAHYTASEETSDHARCPEAVRKVQRYHQDVRGWNDIAYSWVVCVHGTIYEGRGWGVRTAANGTTEGNDNYHAICLMADDDADEAEFTRAAKVAFRSLWLESRERGHGAQFRTHRSLKPTACPGQEVERWVSEKGYLHSYNPAPAPPLAPKPAPRPTTPSWYKRVLDVKNPMLRGADVLVVQRKLRVMPLDGIYGSDTAAKVRGFQKMKGLVADGIVGPRTATALGG